MPTARATLIDADPLAGGDAARAWLRHADGEALTAAAVRTLNRVLHAHRVAAADPSARDVSRAQALVVRVGHGFGDEVAEGRFTDAVELPAPRERARRSGVLRPQERLAALLGGRDAALACEELVLRARSDLAADRTREAALTLRVALEAALAELEPWSARGDLARRLGELRDARGAVAAAANRALQGGLDPSEIEAVEHGVERIEAALRARTAGGID